VVTSSTFVIADMVYVYVFASSAVAFCALSNVVVLVLLSTGGDSTGTTGKLFSVCINSKWRKRGVDPVIFRETL